GSERNESVAMLIDRLHDPNDHENMIDRISLQHAFEHLDQKERQIIILRYFRDKTQTDVAKCIGISQVQVSRIEKKILNQMKESLQ
ncbi:MAG: sigma-70 family RNA polymerase sigma factor, partial [Anaerotignum sp.]|nr:sigma-70 family RNA polymerase sigma factor [Anaerotignum sp.]